MVGVWQKVWPCSRLVQGPLIPQVCDETQVWVKSGLPPRRCVVIPNPMSTPLFFLGKLPKLSGIGRTQACFSGWDSFVMGAMLFLLFLILFCGEMLKKKNQRGSWGLWEASGGNKGTGFEIRVSGAAALAAGGSGQTVPLQGSAEASRSHPTAAWTSFLTATLPAEARSWGGASSGWESGRHESWTQACRSLGQPSLGSVSVLVQPKRDLSEPILLFHFTD